MLTLLHKCTKFAENTSLFAVLLPVYESDTSILEFGSQNLPP